MATAVSRLRAYVAARRSGDAMASFLLDDLEVVLNRAEAAQEWVDADFSSRALVDPARNIPEASGRWQRLLAAGRGLRKSCDEGA